jgi:hypothetical protein
VSDDDDPDDAAEFDPNSDASRIRRALDTIGWSQGRAARYLDIDIPRFRTICRGNEFLSAEYVLWLETAAPILAEKYSAAMAAVDDAVAEVMRMLPPPAISTIKPKRTAHSSDRDAVADLLDEAG